MEGENEHGKYTSWETSFKRLPLMGQAKLFRKILRVDTRNLKYEKPRRRNLVKTGHTTLTTVQNRTTDGPNGTNTEVNDDKKRKFYRRKRSKSRKRSSEAGSTDEESISELSIPEYNYDAITILNSIWPSKNITEETIKMKASQYIFTAIQYSQLVKVPSDRISIIPSVYIPREVAIENELFGYGLLDFIITSDIESRNLIIVSIVSGDNIEKIGLGSLLVQMISWRKWRTARVKHMYGILTNGEKWIFVNYKSVATFHFIERTEIEDILNNISEWVEDVSPEKRLSTSFENVVSDF
eukprot:TRINITY_DN3887_c2_g1_i3.p1 TRINITY_DN3887_c2_g1~~TRINITY_DN3887_c2_g1_i3.p1  ORF type:complete len:297 (-),score=56.13 TRINITY_DN3887_c2_g1_i3:119-1009(-)